MIKVLFVCLGNICRSPIAHGIMQNLIQQLHLENKFMIDSAGTSAYHVGGLSDKRSLDVLAQHGIKLDHLVRQFRYNDMEVFDFILVMDHLNYEDVLNSARTDKQRSKVFLLRSFDPEVSDDFNVPDPYYGNNSDFEDVYLMCERSIRGFIQYTYKNQINSNTLAI